MSRRRKPKEVLDFEREYLFPNGFRETRVNGRDGTGSHLHYLNRVTHKRIEVNTRLNREVSNIGNKCTIKQIYPDIYDYDNCLI